jgi:hypothetical protein
MIDEVRKKDSKLFFDATKRLLKMKSRITFVKGFKSEDPLEPTPTSTWI